MGTDDLSEGMSVRPLAEIWRKLAVIIEHRIKAHKESDHFFYHFWKTIFEFKFWICDHDTVKLNPHIHSLWLDGVFAKVEGNLKFRDVSPVTDDEVADLITAINEKVMRLLKNMDLIDAEGNIGKIL